MALNIPMPESPGKSLLQGLDTGSTLMTRMMAPILERERLKQQQQEFAQNYILHKQAQDRANQLMPFMIQQYQDTHKTAASEAQMKDMYYNIMQEALNSPSASPMTPPPGVMPQGAGAQGVGADFGMSFDAKGNNVVASPQEVEQLANRGAGNASQNTPLPQIGGMPPQMGGGPNIAPGGMPGGGQPPVAPLPPMPPQPGIGQGQEQELRPGNPRLAKLDSVAGLVPGIPKPVTHFNNGMVFTTYPSGRMTVQKMQGEAGLTPGEKGVNAKEASKIRDQATSLINSANLVQEGYDLLDKNPDLTGPGNITSAIPVPFSGGSKINLSNNPNLGKFNTVTGKLQAELGKYASSRGGIQAVKWAGSVKPNPFNPQDYNYGMFEGVQNSVKNDYNTLNQQYKALTGKDLPVSLPNMKRKASDSGGSSGSGTKVKKVWKFVNGKLA